MTNALAALALAMQLTPAQAIALPCAVENASAKVGMSQARFIAECHRIAELREYVAQACRKATA